MNESRDDVSIEELLELTPQLQALAGHLVQDWDRREELIQDTWVRVLNRPPRERSNLASWLRGALRMQRADTVRHQSTAKRKQRVLPEGESTPTPEQVLERAEAHELVVRALRKLEEPYRQVLLLHYFEGLSVNELAKRQDTPRGTVAAQLSRGRERLRARLVSTHGDDAQRICAVAAGPSLIGVVEGASLSSLLLPLGSLAAGLIALAIFVWPSSDELSYEHKSTSASVEVVNDPLSTAGPGTLAEFEQQDERRLLSTDEDSEFESVVITGRCVANDSGDAVDGALIELSVESRRNSLSVFAPEQLPEMPDSIRADADGTFSIEYPHNEFLEYRLRVTAEGYALKRGRWYTSAHDGPMNSENRIELGDVRLLPGANISGRVVDALGQPVSGTTVSMRDLPLGIARLPRSNSSTYGRSSEDGSFELRDAVPFGTWPIDVGDRNGYGNDDAPAVTVGPQFEQRDWVIVVERLPTIKGVVIDLQGKPIQGARIYARDPETHYLSNKMLGSISNSQGRFRIRKRYPEVGSVYLSIDAGTSDAWQSEERYEWGNHGVSVQVKRARDFQVRLIQSSTGDLIHKFGLFASPLTWSPNTRNVSIDSAETTADGYATLHTAPSGDFWLSAKPHDRSWWVRYPKKVSADAASGQLVELEAELLPAVTLQLVGSDQQPLPHAAVAIHDLDASEYRRPGRTFSGHTDRDGLIDLHLPADVPLEIEVTPRLGNRSRQPINVDLSEVMVVQVETGTPVQVNLREPTAWRRAVLQLRPVAHGSQATWLEFDADYRVARGVAMPGDYWLELVTSNRLSEGSGMIWYEGMRVTVPDNGPFEVEIDLRSIQPATVRGKLWLGSQPAKGGQVAVVVDTTGVDRRFRSERVQVASDGSFAIEGVPAGEASFHFLPAEALVEYGDLHFGYAKQSYRILAGIEQAISIELAAESALFRIADQTTPYFDSITLYQNGARLGSIESDLSGTFYFVGCGPGSYEVDVRGKRYGPFLVDAGEEWTEFMVHLEEAGD